MKQKTPLGDHSFTAQITINRPAAITAMTFRQPCAATMAEAKAAEMADAKTAAMAVKLPINLTSKTTFATLPPRRITEALTDVPTLMASKEAY